jgi:hypothetical protein
MLPPVWLSSHGRGPPLMVTTDVSSYALVEGLAVEISDWDLERRELPVSSGFTRVSTTIVLRGGGFEGRGEDVCYDAADHDRFARPELAGRTTVGAFSRRLGAIELFSAEPSRPTSRDYRRWAFESAALDLALRQAEASLDRALGRAYRPVRFVVSTREGALAWHDVDPELEFKLDPTSEWDEALLNALAATDRIRTLDFKAYYTGTAVDQPPDPDLYRRCFERFPDAVVEDAAVVPETRALVEAVQGRLSWDAPIHSFADVEALPFPPRWLNIKPSRFGSIERLLECIDRCRARGIRLYGGGQFELGVGRGQIQALASVFYPDGPNDVAPGGYNHPTPQPGLPRSPLPPPPEPVGFFWPAA